MQVAFSADNAPADEAPYYLPSGNEVEVFTAAYRQHLPLMLKGPTGCGKTRFVEHMAARLGRSLITVACHEDITAADLVGRYLLQGGDTVWVDGPLTRAVRSGAICYLDEVVEARADTTVVIHPLADHRRELILERRAEQLTAHPYFMLVLSYNPGYQSVLKDLKQSTRQRMVGIELGYPPAEREHQILVREGGVSEAQATDLIKLAQAIRQLDASLLPEVCSTRTLVSTAHLIQAGLSPRVAATAAMLQPLCDDAVVQQGLREVVETYLPA
ncbi:CbbQ/NirQ/NorQ/GpvN family protein [Denitromonas ohlonensis]|uniref:CbbQ/NirQ/NorQ/GpvN family protein n=2 Tax=Denitromonas TaxID=139331 RepID=A0A557REF8_9RHOO|nr:CbbQ/NirQ/NorQ/GpvN family protein [Denitromonas ohlonensis]TVT48681.1 MAG: CbbQ/NirQ/NorQ/GpvN family protein [Denitromonas halophila]TVO63550.1 CbbQ/NirQ/NorQ/GpvN family protein [Denitromonas ohlonensis]TVO75427.1 CbbQ/NirQ/NorQ/GpvN family protein [Denitromonas ohlonensis]TVT70574.1 MAG: CbbQ/NirQ/NorQ/GpvN family protein [Denitromonas halophila]TVT75696.1 MAG: CbbQ/NirQ/NorQ/GpvN family protein [Denitromonas halophila]